MTDFLKNLTIGPLSDTTRMPVFTRPADWKTSSPGPELLKPQYSYDLKELEEVRAIDLTELDSIREQKLRAIQAQMIPGVRYECIPEERRDAYILNFRPTGVDRELIAPIYAAGALLRAICP